MDLNKVIENSEVLNNGVIMLSDDEMVFDYLHEQHGSKIVKALGESDKNTGVSLFFDVNSNYRDLILVMRMKDFEKAEHNGFILFAIKDVHVNARAKETLIQMIRNSFEDNTVLRDEVIIAVEQHTIVSIQHNA